MSGWRNLGTVSVGENWNLFPEISFGANLFRLTQAFNPEWRPWNARLLLSPAVELTSKTYRYRTRAYYPSLDERVIVWEIPNAFEERGLIMRNFYAKHSFYTRVSPETNWQVTLEEYQE